MSHQHTGQYEPAELTENDVMEIFRNNYLLWVAYAGFAASLSAAVHVFILRSGSDSDMANIFGALLTALVFVSLFLIVANSAWKRKRERREVEFLVGQIKKKYDTTGMVFNELFQNYRQVTGTLTSANFSKPIDVIFVFHSQTNEAMYLGSHASVDFYPTPLFLPQSY